MHYYQFNIGDYSSHTNHLDPLEDIAYRRMLDYCYLHESHLPNSIEMIAKKIRMRSHCDCIESVLQEFFEQDEYGYFQARIIKEVEAYKNKSIKAKASADARWAAKPIESNANALQTDSERNAKHKPLNIKQEPLNNNKKESRKLKFSSDDMKAAVFINSLIIRETNKQPNLDDWANTIRLMTSSDGLTHKRVCEVFKHANQDPFWASNIQSPKKLRSQFETLAAQMKRPTNQQSLISSSWPDVIRKLSGNAVTLDDRTSKAINKMGGLRILELCSTHELGFKKKEFDTLWGELA